MLESGNMLALSEAHLFAMNLYHSLSSLDDQAVRFREERTYFELNSGKFPAAKVIQQ